MRRCEGCGIIVGPKYLEKRRYHLRAKVRSRYAPMVEMLMWLCEWCARLSLKGKVLEVTDGPLVERKA